MKNATKARVQEGMFGMPKKKAQMKRNARNTCKNANNTRGNAIHCSNPQKSTPQDSLLNLQAKSHPQFGGHLVKISAFFPFQFFSFSTFVLM